MNAAHRILRRPRLLAVIGFIVVLSLSVVGYRVLSQNEEMPPLTQADIDQTVSRVTIQHLEPLQATLSQTTTHMAQLRSRTDSQHTALRALQTEITDLLEQLSQLRAKNDWQRALEHTQQHWQSAQTSLTRRVQHLETQMAHARKTESASKSTTARSLPAIPPFQVSAVEHWGDTPYVTVTSNSGRNTSLRQGQAYAGWRLADVTHNHAVFVNGAHSHELPVER